MKQFEKIFSFPPELKGRFNSFITTEFDDSMTVEMQIRVLIKWIKLNIDLTNSMVDYLNDFILKFDAKLYDTVYAVLNKWVLDGTLEELIDKTLFHEINVKLNNEIVRNDRQDELIKNITTGRYIYIASFTKLQTDYPTGHSGVFVTEDTNTVYTWDGVSWVNNGVINPSEIPDNYVGAKKLKEGVADNILSLYSTKQKDWNVYIPVTTLGSPYLFRGKIDIVDSSFYYTSMANYGCSSKLIELDPREEKLLLKTIDKTLYLAIIEYNERKEVIKDSTWQMSPNLIEYPLQSTTKYIVIMTKKYDPNNTGLTMTLDEVVSYNANVYCEYTNKSLNDYVDSVEKIEELYYSNDNTSNFNTELVLTPSSYRVSSNIINIQKSKKYVIKFNSSLFDLTILQLNDNNFIVNDCGWIIIEDTIEVIPSTETTKLLLKMKKKDNGVMTYSDYSSAKLSINGYEFLDVNNSFSISEELFSERISQGLMSNVKNEVLKLYDEKTRLRSAFFVKLLPNKKYIFNFSLSNQQVLFQHYKKDFTGKESSLWLKNTYTYTTNGEDEILFFMFRNSDNSDITPTSLKVNYFNVSEFNNEPIGFKKINIMAHRGANKYAPENTLNAFYKAIELGYSGIETDVQLTKDGELIIMHDDTVDRTTNGTGLVSSLTLSEIKALTVKNDDGLDIKVPTLKECLQLIKANDIKAILHTHYIEGLANQQKIIDLVDFYNVSDSIFVMCKNQNENMNFRTINRSIKLIPAVSTPNEMYYGLGYGNSGCSVDFKLDYIDTIKDKIKDLHKRGGFLNTFVINEMFHYNLLAENGVDLVVTDDIELITGR